MISKFRRRRITGIVLGSAALAALAGLVVSRPDRALQVSTGLTAQTLCSAVFVSGQDAKAVFAESIAPMIGVSQLASQISYTVDTARKEVRSDLAGMFRSRAVYRGAAGCGLIASTATPALAPRLSSSPASELTEDDLDETRVVPVNHALDRVLGQAFVEPASGPPRHLKALVVVKDGVVVGERYASDITADTRLMGYSLTKTVVNALVGILVREGKLRVSDRAPVAAWNTADDRRRDINIDQLLRMTSGLAAEETHSGFDFTSRMLFAEDDMARFAEHAGLKHDPGRVWEYQSPNTIILSRIIQRAVGGRQADTLEFARKELFWRLGMQSAVLETDAVGTPVGSQGMLATARDWARLGQLYINDGVVNRTRVLPENWVAYSTTPTLGSTYGAGLWTNRSSDTGSQARITRAGMPADAFYASGNLGQRIYVIPSRKLVVVRLGVTHSRDNGLKGDMGLLREVLIATR